jgi:hypothetical protein
MPASLHPIFSLPPSSGARIWRYMDIAKFSSMLQHQSLYLCRADLIGDPFEGSVPRNNPGSVFNPRSFPPDQFQRVTEDMTKARLRHRKRVYLNCWHMSEVESAAMWKLYGKIGDAIAIASQFDRLHNCIASSHSEPFYIGTVKYINYDGTDAMPDNNMFWPYLHKRKSFQHECEVRVVHQVSIPSGMEPDIFEGHPNIWKAVDLEQLIMRVFVSPESPPQFKEQVENVCKTYWKERLIEQSDLNEEPFF